MVYVIIYLVLAILTGACANNLHVKYSNEPELKKRWSYPWAIAIISLLWPLFVVAVAVIVLATIVNTIIKSL